VARPGEPDHRPRKSRVALAALLLLGGCVDYADFNQSATRQQQVQENAVTLSRWDLYLNSRIDDLYARTAILEALRRGCRLH
jgi:hypothetical protein